METTKAPSTTVKDSQADNSFDTIFAFEAATSSEPSTDSDASEYGKKGRQRLDKPKKRKIKTKKGQSRKTQYIKDPAPLPEMSDDALPSEDSLEFGRSVRKPPARVRARAQNVKATEPLKREVSLPVSRTIIQLHIDNSSGKIINLDMANLFHGKRAYDEADLSSTTVVGENASDVDSQNQSPSSAEPVSKRCRLLQQAKAKKLLTATKKIGFTDLPYEVREDIYRRIFVQETAIDFTSRFGFSRSASFLRTCRMVHVEGRGILYGENAFHFRRCHDRRGNYWTTLWVEIGFKDVRRFLEDIGPANLSLLQYVSFELCDAAPSGTPHLTENERRFVNDPVLHHIFELIGSHAHLLKFAFECSPRRSVTKLDYHFLRSLGTIRAQEVIYISESWASTNKVSANIIHKLKQVMTLAKEDENEIDQRKKKKQGVKMHYERERKHGRPYF